MGRSAPLTADHRLPALESAAPVERTAESRKARDTAARPTRYPLPATRYPLPATHSAVAVSMPRPERWQRLGSVNGDIPGSFAAPRNPPLQLIEKVQQHDDVHQALVSARGFRHRQHGETLAVRRQIQVR